MANTKLMEDRVALNANLDRAVKKLYQDHCESKEPKQSFAAFVRAALAEKYERETTKGE